MSTFDVPKESTMSPLKVIPHAITTTAASIQDLGSLNSDNIIDFVSIDYKLCEYRKLIQYSLDRF